MRVNVYAEEMTDRIEIIAKEIDGRTFTGLRFFLELPATVNGQQYQGPFMHRPGDDDSSAVTFWGKRDLRVVLRKALAELDRHYAESASPPRVPGASAYPSKVGVESGPGQPMDMCDLLKVAEGWGDPSAPAATLAREAAAEIRRLREQVKAERRAGIEAAAKWHDEQAAEWNEHYAEHGDSFAREYAKQHRTDAAAIRALADKPAPDPLLPGIEHVREHLRADGNAARLIAWLDAEIAVRKGG